MEEVTSQLGGGSGYSASPPPPFPWASSGSLATVFQIGTCLGTWGFRPGKAFALDGFSNYLGSLGSS